MKEGWISCNRADAKEYRCRWMSAGNWDWTEWKSIYLTTDMAGFHYEYRKRVSNYPKDYWEERLPDNLPEKVKNAIKRIYNSYPQNCLPQGLADPMYIMNTIAFELGIGDGQGNFKGIDDEG